MLTLSCGFRLSLLSGLLAGCVLSCSTVKPTNSNDRKPSENNNSNNSGHTPVALNGTTESKGGMDGACFLICEGKEFACVNTVEKRCVDAEKYELFRVIPRCPHTLEYRARETCK